MEQIKTTYGDKVHFVWRDFRSFHPRAEPQRNWHTGYALATKGEAGSGGARRDRCGSTPQLEDSDLEGGRDRGEARPRRRPWRR